MEPKYITAPVTLTNKTSENLSQRLLKELINNSENYINNKELKQLSETLKRIFYHGLSLDTHVSNILIAMHQKHYKSLFFVMSQKCNAVNFNQLRARQK